MNYGVFFREHQRQRSLSYPDAYNTEKEARAAINSGKPLALEPKEYEIRPLVDVQTRRNNQQRARRASPEAKAREVVANRKSRFRALVRNEGWEGIEIRNNCNCPFCVKAIAAGFKPGDLPVPEPVPA